MINRLHAITFMVVLALAALAQAQTFTVLYNFTGSSDGAYPSASLITAKAGNLYGTAYLGGAYGNGLVFELNSAGAETVLYNFKGGPSDGGSPFAPVIRDSKGNIYGTTYYGGSSYCGVVFKIDAEGNESVLYSFAGGTSDGCYPYQGLVRDKAGNLYGTTHDGGFSGYGTVFKIDTAGNETILHNFAGGSSDGQSPLYGHLFRDKEGNLYGLTTYGGSSSGGVLYKLTQKGKLTLLYSFAGGTSDGCVPYGTVAMDKTGNFYGTTGYCGASGNGIVWKVSKKGKETILHSFAGTPSDGGTPLAGVVLDTKGNMYGDTNSGGANGYGTVYKLRKSGTLTLLHSFADTDGANPYGEVLRTTNGELFGTAVYGGTYNAGTVWKYVP